MWNEIGYARRRVNAMLRTDAVIMNTVIVQALVGGHHLSELLEKLDGGE